MVTGIVAIAADNNKTVLMELSLASENSLSNSSRLGQPGRVGRRKSKDLRKSLIEITRNVCYVPRGIWHKMSSGVHS